MKVMVLSPYPERITAIVERSGGEVSDTGHFDWIVSYGHRRILKGNFLREYEGRMVNLHISFLPWNRGSDPNLWSWYENTKKGVSLHLIDAGIDTGPIVAQREVGFSLDETLASSYEKLHAAAAALFADKWPSLMSGAFSAEPQNLEEGSFHRSADKLKLLELLPQGWNTLCKTVEELGERMRQKELRHER